MSRRHQLLCLTAFAVALCVPLLLFVAGVRPDVEENRARTDWPSFTSSGVLDDATYSQISDYVTERFPLRDVAIEVEQDLSEAMSIGSGEAATVDDEVVDGRDGWLFFRNTLLHACPGRTFTEYLDAVDEMYQEVTAIGVPLVVAHPPDKALIYPEQLPSDVGAPGLAGLLGLRGAPPACGSEWREDLDAAAADRDWLFALSGAVDEQTADSEVPTFYERDTHWTDAGSITMVEAVVEAFAPGLFDADDLVPGPPATGGDLTLLRGALEVEEADSLLVEREGVTYEFDERRGLDLGVTLLYSRATGTESEPVIPGTTVILADSFGQKTRHLLAPYFEEIIFVHLEYLAETGTGGIVTVRPDRILVEQVHRNLYLREGTPLMFTAAVELASLPAG